MSGSHIVIAAGAAVGHFNSCNFLAEHLARLGYLITLVHAALYEVPESSETIRRYRITDIPDPSLLRPLELDMWLALDSKKTIPDSVWTNNNQWPRAVLVIFDFFAVYARGEAIAAEINTAVYSSCSMGALYYLNEFHPGRLDATQTLVLPELGDMDAHVDPHDFSIPEYLFPRWLDMWKMMLEAFRDTTCLYINDVDGWYGNNTSFRAKLQDKFLHAEGRKNPLEIICVGPIAEGHRKVDEPVNAPELEFLENHQESTVVLIAFGSWTIMSQESLNEFAWGLLDSGYPFIWALRETENSLLSWDFRNSAEQRGLIVPWIDQPKVLSHPALKGFVSHGGWNSLSEAMSLSGKPILCVPLAAEQGLNSKFITHVFKNGTSLWDMNCQKTSRSEVATALKAAMENPDYAANARRIQAQAQLAAGRARFGVL